MARTGSISCRPERLVDGGSIMRKHILSLLAALSMFAVLILPASAEMNLSAGSSSMSNRGKTVIIELTFTCEFAGYYTIEGSIYQMSGRDRNVGYVSSGEDGTCQAGDRVTAIVGFSTTADLAFKPGPAQIFVIVDVYHQTLPQYDESQLVEIVRLKR